ncbi:MAG: protein kinase domain-containing protein, partial [Myxococcota bacterium]
CVWKGEDEALGRPVTVKMLRPEMAERAGLVERFRAEAQTVGRLNHPNIATVYSLLEESGEVFLVMEFVEGETLATRIRHDGPFSLEACFDLFHQILDGVHHAHEAGIVHRDVKPSNVMVDDRGLVKLLDFGIARSAGSPRITRAGGIVGTPHYMSPEQVQGEEGSVRSDVYALGLLLYELTVGRLPFEGEAEFDIMRAQVEVAPGSPREGGADLPEPVEAVLLRALSKDPGERYPTVMAFQDALVAAGAPARTGCSRERRTSSGERPAPGERPTRILGDGEDAPTRPRAARQEPPTIQFDESVPPTIQFDEPVPPTIQFDEPVLPTRIDSDGSPSAAWVLGGALLAGLVLLAMNQVGAFDTREADPVPVEIHAPQLAEEPAAGDAAAPVTEGDTAEPEAQAEPPESEPPHEQESATPNAPSEAPAAGPTGWEIRR